MSVSFPIKAIAPKGELPRVEVGPVLRRFFTSVDDFFVDLFSRTLSNTLFQRQVAERAVRVALTIVEPPGFDDSLSLGHLGEPVHIQAFIAQSVVMRLNEGIIHRFAGSNEVELQTSPIGSIFQRS